MAQENVSGSTTSESGRGCGRRGDGPVGEEGKDVEQGERDRRDQCAAGEPLELLALERVLRVLGAPVEQARGPDVVDGHVAVGDLVQPVQQQLGGGPAQDGHDLERDQAEPGQVEQGGERALAAALGGAWGKRREGEREMQKQCGLQRRRHNVRPVDDLIEGVQLPGVLERVEHERDQAEDEKVR